MTERTPMTMASIEPDAGLRAALALDAPGVVATIKESGMKGRGGAGFPTGLKWEFAAAAPAPDGRRYVVCNADEGEPGTFKDRVILDKWADLVFEGMTIAAYAIGAEEGYLYLRGEYAYMEPAIEACLKRRRDANLLGRDILGVKDFSFNIHVHLGSGAYVCGEETALIESLEGKRGEPRNRPPFPVVAGLNGAPTTVNNVETFAWAAAIMANGADWFSAIGTEKSKGPKMFSVSGDVTKPGVFEFPLGISIRDLLAAAGGEDAKAVIIGGASGQCVPSAEFSRQISYEDISTGGAVIVIGPNRDLLEVAENIQEFFADEACGQCTPCRVGNVRILEGIRALRDGTCSEKRLLGLTVLGGTMQIASKCGLGQSAPNVFLSIVKHYQSEILERDVATVV
jgi:[NiFe] hydrogenase diaphorase moiety large subunit